MNLVLNNREIVVEKALKNYEGGLAINSHTGMNHPLFFTAFNIAMFESRPRACTLDYYACKREIESIRGFLSKNSSNTIMLPS